MSGFRKCSYCFKRLGWIRVGHDRRNCPYLLSDRNILISKNKIFRENILDQISDQGIGIGSLVSFPTYEYGITQAVITSAHWDRVSCVSSYRTLHPKYCFEATSTRSMVEGRNFAFSLPHVPENRLHVEVLVPQTPASIRKSIPKTWLDGISGLDRYFDRKYDPRYQIGLDRSAFI